MRNADIYTLTWNYSIGQWNKGALVSTEVVGGITYLRSVKDDSVNDNLAHLIDYD